MRNTRREFIKHSTIAGIGSALLPISAHGQNNRVQPAPMMPEPRFIQTNGSDMAVYEKGEGPAVVFCHGWPELAFSTASIYKNLIAFAKSLFCLLKNYPI